jgi:hypothetical protein
LQAFHLLGGIANCLAIGQLIRGGDLRPHQYCTRDPHKCPSHYRTHVCTIVGLKVTPDRGTEPADVQ